jgi:hypothetical protein
MDCTTGYVIFADESDEEILMGWFDTLKLAYEYLDLYTKWHENTSFRIEACDEL